MPIDRITSQRASAAYTDNTIQQPATTSGTAATQGSGKVGEGVAQSGALTVGATIKLSPQAQLFAQALAAAQATPDVRADRVAAARAKLANGEEHGDVNALASKLLGKSEQ